MFILMKLLNFFLIKVFIQLELIQSILKIFFWQDGLFAKVQKRKFLVVITYIHIYYLLCMYALSK